MPFDHLQQILGTNKKNRTFSVHKHSLTGHLHVYYGLELFEVVPDDKEDTRFKIMVAHLRNAGAKLSELQDAFHVDPRAVNLWSDALKSGSADRIAKALAGQKGGRKLTPQIAHYIRVRFPVIYADDRYTYSSKIRREVEEIFQTKLCGETLRPLFSQLKDEFNHRSTPRRDEPQAPAVTDETARHDVSPTAQSANEAVSKTSQQAGPDMEAAPSGDAPQRAPETGPVPQAAAEPPTEEGGDGHPQPRSAPKNRRQSVEFSTPRWCSHLGLLVFCESLVALRSDLPEEQSAAVCHFAAEILLGAANLEQTKLLSQSDLDLLLKAGSAAAGPGKQRQILAELALDTELPAKLLRWNYAQLGGDQLDVFYYDPHTKHYTGGQNVLKGWCSSIRWAGPILIGDFVHTTSGSPIYLENCDNYQDMRERFKGLEARFRKCFSLPDEKPVTWVIDRGIYGSEVFEWIAGRPGIHIVTWEKDYKKNGWGEGRPADGSFTVERPRNHREDIKTYRFAWVENEWNRNAAFREIVVRATNPQDNTIEVSILTDDANRPPKELIWLMFDRWVQENDFKYMDSHFGINQITSYMSTAYEEIRNELDDRMMKNVEHTALVNNRLDRKKKAGDLLFQERESEKKQSLRQKEIESLESVPADQRTPELKIKLGRLRGAQRSAEKHKLDRSAKLDEIDKQIEALDQKAAATEKEISRLDVLIEQGAVRMLGERKYLLDVIKIASRNMFYRAFEPFKELYDNFRDDHVWFRHLQRSPGLLEAAGDRIKCLIIPTADLPKSVRAVVKQTLNLLNSRWLQMPDLSGRRIEFALGGKSAIGTVILGEQFEGEK